MATTVVIPVERGQEQQWWLPDGTRYKLCFHEPGDRANAIDTGVAEADTTYVLPLPHDGQLHEEDLAMLESCCWNDRATYPSVVGIEGDKPSIYVQAQPWCPQRLRRFNYIGPSALVRRDSFLAAGGWGMGAWDLWLRLGRMRCVDQAKVGLRSVPEDQTLPPMRNAVAASFYCQASYQTTYYRCQLPARYLPGVVMPGVPKPLEREDGEPGFCWPGNEGTAIWQFPGDAIRAGMIKTMRAAGIRSLIEVDDNYLQRYGTQARAGWVYKEKDPASDHSIERHRAIAESVDGVIVTSEELAQRYRKVNPHVFVCPNQVEPDDWPAFDKPDDGVIRVGWFASQSHQNDAYLIETTLRWLKAQKNVEIVLMGAGAHRKTLQTPEGQIISEQTAHWYPFLTADEGAVYRYIPQTNDLAVYWRMMMGLDIGLGPVRPDHWAICRSDLKGLEYALAGVCPILSDVPAFQGWKDGVTCLKARKPSEFLRHVKNLVRDPARAKEIAAAARAYTLGERTVEKNVWRWQEAIADMQGH